MQRWDLDSGVSKAVLSNTIATSYRWLFKLIEIEQKFSFLVIPTIF